MEYTHGWHCRSTWCGEIHIIAPAHQRTTGQWKILVCECRQHLLHQPHLGQSRQRVCERQRTHLFVDEVHKYPHWSRELKNIYDEQPDLHIVFTGSSVLDILHGEADLSRRTLMRTMQGLSFREFLELNHGIISPAYKLDEIVQHKVELRDLQHPLPLFRQYLKEGYYPFSKEDGFYERLQQIISLTLDMDILQYADLRASTAAKLKLLLTIIAQLAPYKPNMTDLASEIGVSKNNIQDYLSLLERAGLIAQLHDDVGGIRLLGKVMKVYLDNPTLMYTCGEVN